MRSGRSKRVSVALKVAGLAGLALSEAAVAQTVFYAQTFDGAVRNQVSGDPAVTQVCGAQGPAFTHQPPAGWTWSNCDMVTYACRVGTPTCSVPINCGPANSCGTGQGVREWEGWSFTSKSFWGVRTDNQNRQQFTLGVGNVAVADPDEWDDRTVVNGSGPAIDCGLMNTWMGTPTIDLTGVTAGSLAVVFDSSWRPEGFDDTPTNNQTAIIRAIYTVGGVDQPAVEVMRWDSDNNGLAPGNYYKPDATNETVTLVNAFTDESHPGLNVPVGATAVRFEFGLVEAANDWWWAIDNIRVIGDVGGTAQTLFTEDFESVMLEPPVHEIPQGCATAYCGQNVYTHTLGGVNVTVDSPATGGVADWRGWSFVDRAYWNCTSGGNGSGFTNGTGLIAVADGDEFDDLPHDPGPLDTTMSIPNISLASRVGSLVVVSFDSAWLYEDPQEATVEAVFNDANATRTTILRWSSNTSSPFFKPDAPNELVAVGVTVPQDATSMTLNFRYVGFNNWYWAIDNVRVFEGEATVTLANLSPAQGSMAVAPSTDYAPCTTPWSPTPPAGWSEVWSPSGGCPTECGRPEWRGWSFAFKDWWWQRVDNQNRSLFTRGRGFVAIADPDEWDDFANNSSLFNAFMTTPAIALPNTITSASLAFDSSWRPEAFDDNCSCDPNPPASTIVSVAAGNPAVFTTSAPHGFQTGNYVTIAGSNAVPSMNGRVRVEVINDTQFSVPITVTTAGTTGTATRRNTNNQTAIIKAIYTVGGVDQPAVEVMRWDSDGGRAASGEQIYVPPSPYYHDDNGNWNEGVTLERSALQIPANATHVKFEFSLTKARNDWWWAIDNIDLRVNNNSLFSENFENVPDLAAPPTELPPIDQCFYFSTVEQQGGGFTATNSGTCPPGDDFTGFHAWYVDAWSRALGGLRTEHLATTAFISDFAARNCDGESILLSPSYGINALNANSLTLTFRSGWFAEAGHVSTVEVTYDNGMTWTPVLTWNPGTKMTNTDETVTVSLNNPQGAASAQIRFRDRDSGWWAISAINLTGVVGTPRCVADVDDGTFNGQPDGGVTIDDLLYYLSIFEAGDVAADVDDGTFTGTLDGGVTIDDLLYFLSRFEAGC